MKREITLTTFGEMEVGAIINTMHRNFYVKGKQDECTYILVKLNPFTFAYYSFKIWCQRTFKRIYRFFRRLYET